MITAFGAEAPVFQTAAWQPTTPANECSAYKHFCNLSVELLKGVWRGSNPRPVRIRPLWE
jgi:hypothetical protein